MLPGGCSLSAFRQTVAGVVELARQGTLADRVGDHVKHSTWQVPSRAESRSWEKSLPILANDLCDAGLAAVEMLVEYQLPLTSSRADVVLAGVDPRTGDDCVRHRRAQAVDPCRASGRRTRTSSWWRHTRRAQAAPGLQVQGYCEYTADFWACSPTTTAVSGVAYLHNAVDVRSRTCSTSSRALAAAVHGQRRASSSTSCAAPVGRAGAGAADRLMSSSVQPSKNLMAVAAAEISDREQFVLLDQQRLAYKLVFHATEAARRLNTRPRSSYSAAPAAARA